MSSTKITVRVDPQLTNRLDALIPYIASTSGKVATRSDVLRDAMMLGLRVLEGKVSGVVETKRRGRAAKS
jgi:Arc/MetJ-type ribon-helix-helix transcriptional regulator